MHVNVGFNFFISKDFLKKNLSKAIIKAILNSTILNFSPLKKVGIIPKRFQERLLLKQTRLLAGLTYSQRGDLKDETSPKAARNHLRAAGKRSEVIYRLGRATGSHMRASQG